MYFKRLELVGFKSFAKKTVLDFEPGITAVVGPNGCGKSNIFDSIRWVLGEQSVKSLRGSQMEDVIFNGTETEPSLGFAEVSLMFDNSGKNLPIEYEEVIITRRLYRSGESEYLINKSQVRLKDISALFMGTGIGAESYSLVEQGKIDLIVSIKPEERRFIVDEAAGITKYKSKKKEALKKLEDTENNLLRLSDIISEVKRQIASIERQANKARRYKEQFDRLKDLETQVAFYELGDLNKDIGNGEKDIETLSQEEQKLKNELADKIEHIEEIDKELNVLKDEVQESKNNLVEGKNIQKLNSENIKRNLERIDEYAALVDDLEKKKEDLDKRIQSEEENISILDSELSLLQAKVRETSDDLAKKENFIEENNSLFKSLQNNIATAKKEIFEKTTSLTSRNNELTDASGQLMSWQARKRRLDIEIAKIKQEKSTVNEQFIQVQEEFNKAEAGICSIKKEIEGLNSSIAAKEADLDKYNKIITDLESELITLESQREFLQNLKLRYDNLPDATKAAIFVDSKTLTEGLACGVLGRVLQPQEMNKREKDIFGEEYNSKFTVEIKPIDLDAKNITKRIEEIKQKITQEKSKKESIAKQIQIEKEICSNKNKELHQREISFSNISLKKTDFESQLTRFDEEIGLVEAELKEAEDLLFDLEKKMGNLKLDISNFQEQLSNLDNNINQNQLEISKCNSAREREIINITRLKAEFSALEEARSNQIQTRKLLEGTKNNHIIDKESVILQEKDLKQKLDNAQKDNSRLEKENIELNERLSLLEKELESLQLRLNDNSTALEKFEQDKAGISKHLEENSTKLFNLRLSVQEIEFKRKSILDRMQQLYHMQDSEINVMISKHSETDANIPSIEELKQEIEMLRKRIDSYGNVNLVAVEEHEELKKRLEFLTVQSNDLLQAKESLMKAIRKINQTSRRLFLETFEAVNEEFKNYFRMLFGGGQGHLFLVDEQDPLESGIEIVCRPPGKKLQNVLLLSGGEKSLAAIALMFAIFKVKPAPFCVLDEVDGALDEANIDRFRKILEEFSNTSQFIVITHNKKTISSSDTMYGITMEETGISKIVSVRFAKERQEKEAEIVNT